MTSAAKANALSRRKSTKRPVGVWVLALVVLIPQAAILLAFLTGRFSISSVINYAQIYYPNLKLVDALFACIVAALNFAAAINLLQLRRLAFFLFATAAGFNVLAVVWQLIHYGPAWLPVAFVVRSAIAAVIVLGYTYRLMSQQILH